MKKMFLSAALLVAAIPSIAFAAAAAPAFHGVRITTPGGYYIVADGNFAKDSCGFNTPSELSALLGADQVRLRSYSCEGNTVVCVDPNLHGHFLAQGCTTLKGGLKTD